MSDRGLLFNVCAILVKDRLVVIDHSFGLDEGGPLRRPAGSSRAVVGSVLRFSSLPWPCCLSVKRRKPRCAFEVKRWRLRRRLLGEPGVEGQRSDWWLLEREKKWNHAWVTLVLSYRKAKGTKHWHLWGCWHLICTWVCDDDIDISYNFTHNEIMAWRTL